MTVAQIPEQIARDIIVREYGEIEITRTNVLVDGARLVELIAAGIKAADEQRTPASTCSSCSRWSRG